MRYVRIRQTNPFQLTAIHTRSDKADECAERLREVLSQYCVNDFEVEVLDDGGVIDQITPPTKNTRPVRPKEEEPRYSRCCCID